MTKRMEGLILSRKKNQMVVIDLREFGLGLVKVMCLGQRNGQARLMFNGDERIPIHREEVFDQIERQKVEVSQ